ncbi:MAG: NFACT RNA binding domain-containing protein [Candidatus Pacearchaeota archaeon]
MVKFRNFITSSGKIVFGGKSAENNEELIKQVKPNEVVLHTAMPGSPFVNIKGEVAKKDIKDAAIFCAKYSQDWRDNKKDVLVHIFNGTDIFKDKKMKIGTFGVKKFNTVKVKKEDILKLERETKENHETY